MNESLFKKLEVASAAVGLTPRPAFSYDDSMIELDRSEFNKRMEIMEQVIRQDERDKLNAGKTDLDRTKEFLDSIGVLYSQDEILHEKNWSEDIVPTHSIAFGKENYHDDGYPPCDKVKGYNGFYTCFNFDENGKFLTVGVWE